MRRTKPLLRTLAMFTLGGFSTSATITQDALLPVAIPVYARQSAYPPISKREFVGGSVKVKVTGTFTIDEEVQINTKASIGGGDMTWLQHGASGRLSLTRSLHSRRPRKSVSWSGAGSSHRLLASRPVRNRSAAARST
ncbi:MAG TPA: hypothetical protein VGQ52_02070 [Gemmatimonadaceae bacterium]|nr:hypothetical protein [Gemmatimonadaceae bacterium]